jgi:hypothetical protein
VKKLIVGGVIAAGLGLGFAVPAQAAPCAYFSPSDTTSGRGQGICGVPNLQQSMQNGLTNLQNNLSPQIALGNLQKNLDPATAATNLKKNLGLG